jgi:hypothetical protein
MTNIYRFECRAICPIHAELIDVYQVEVRSCSTVPVEKILEHFAQYETVQIFQEDMTKKAAVALGCSVSTRGMHSGVEVISYAP